MSDSMLHQLQQFIAESGVFISENFNEANEASTSHHQRLVSQSIFRNLLNCNKVLAYNKPHEGICLIYVKRSLIYEKKKLFKECLNNIMLAENHNSKEDFTERKQFCQLALQQQLQLKSEEKKHFKLSHAPNPRMPFVIDCLKLENNTMFGNHIITVQDLKIGDVVCVENPLFAVATNNRRGDTTFIEPESCYQRCSHCFKSNNMDLIPCDGCWSSMFCSIECKNVATRIYHKYECFINVNIHNVTDIVHSMRSFFVTLYLYGGNILAMKKSIETRGERGRTVFDYDLSDPRSPNYSRSLLTIFDSYKAVKKNTSLSIIITIFNCHPELAVIWKGNENFILHFLDRHADNLRELGQVILKWPGNTTQLIADLPESRNIFEINLVRKIVGVGYYPFYGLINHSCIPNIVRHINEHNQMVLIVCRPIQKGEQLFDDYTGHLYFCKEPRSNRLKELFQQYSFVCTCNACRVVTSSLYPVLKDQKIIRRELFRMTADAARGIKIWNRKEARQKYLHFLGMFKNYFTSLPTQELSFLQYWLFIILAMTERPESSF